MQAICGKSAMHKHLLKPFSDQNYNPNVVAFAHFTQKHLIVNT